MGGSINQRSKKGNCEESDFLSCCFFCVLWLPPFPKSFSAKALNALHATMYSQATGSDASILALPGLLDSDVCFILF